MPPLGINFVTYFALIVINRRYLDLNRNILYTAIGVNISSDFYKSPMLCSGTLLFFVINTNLYSILHLMLQIGLFLLSCQQYQLLCTRYQCCPLFCAYCYKSSLFSSYICSISYFTTGISAVQYFALSVINYPYFAQIKNTSFLHTN